MGNFFSDVGDVLFGETEKLTPRDIRDPAQQKLFGELVTAAGPGATKLLETAGEPFPSGLVRPTPLTGLQKELFAGIPGLFEDGPFTEGPLFQQSVDVLSRTAEGFDPFKDTRLTAFRKSLEQELKRAKDRIAARTSKGQEFFGGGRIEQERELEEQGVRDIGTLAAQLEAQSRQQAINAALQLPNLAMLQQEAPLDYTGRAMEFANIPRAFDEQTRLALLQELQRQRGELQTPLNVAMQTSMFNPTLAYPLYSSTPGLLGGPSGVGMQPGGGVNRNVQMMTAGLSGLSGAGGGGGLGGFASGALGVGGQQTGQNKAIQDLLFKILGGQQNIGVQ